MIQMKLVFILLKYGRFCRHCDDYNVLGFACEWVRSGRVRRPVALLQLSSYHGLSTLVRLSQMSTIPPAVMVIVFYLQVVG